MITKQLLFCNKYFERQQCFQEKYVAGDPPKRLVWGSNDKEIATPKVDNATIRKTA
jgi:hypothetical protein